MTDHSGFPLWDEEGGTGPEHWPMLSPGLVRNLQEWEDYWSRHCARFRGVWQPKEARGWYVAEGQRLAAKVEEELGIGWDVRLILD